MNQAVKQADIVHIFVCTNQKLKGKCCARYQSEQMADTLTQFINAKAEFISENRRIKVVKTGCLGRCARGPNIFIPDANVWYKCASEQELEALIDGHFIEGKIVEHLLNQD